MTVIVEAGPFNGPDDADSAMNWVDITNYVNDNLQPPTTSVGRQTELQQVNPGSFTLVLNNQDHRFTPGNPSSPYYPGWRTSMRLRLRETIGYKTFTHFDGNLLQPELLIQTPGLDQTVTVNATDRLGRLQQGRKFVSTLAEHILFNGGTSLKAYYPLNENRAPLRDLQGNQNPLYFFEEETASGASAGVTTKGTYTLGGGTNPPGDDVAGIRFTPSTVMVGNFVANAWSYSLATTTIAGNPGDKSRPLIHAGDTLTFVCWLNLDSAFPDIQSIISAQIADAATKTVVTQLSVYRDADVSVGVKAWTAKLDDFGTGGLVSTITGPSGDIGGRMMLVGAQFGYTPNTFKLWIDDREFTATPSGSLVDAQYLTLSNSFGPLAGSISHVQEYIGSYTRAQFLAQRDMGFTGMAGQYTGQRVSTIAQYAGVAAGDTEIDAGTSRMQKASLAGRSPLDVMQEAATTEQGLLHAAGRRLIFHDRLRRYNR